MICQLKNMLMTQWERAVFLDIINHYKIVSGYKLETLILILQYMINFTRRIQLDEKNRIEVDPFYNNGILNVLIRSTEAKKYFYEIFNNN